MKKLYFLIPLGLWFLEKPVIEQAYNRFSSPDGMWWMASSFLLGFAILATTAWALSENDI